MVGTEYITIFPELGNLPCLSFVAGSLNALKTMKYQNRHPADFANTSKNSFKILVPLNSDLRKDRQCLAGYDSDT